MAKFHGFIKGDMKGNAGQLSFRQQGGMTIVSGRIYNNKSAGEGASYAQRMQRIKISGAVNLFKAIQAFEKKAWEGKPVRVSDYNMFIKKNLAGANVYFTKEEANLGACVPMRCVISQGSLSSIDMTWLTPDIALNLSVGDLTLANDTTVAQLASAIIANNSGYMANDKITFGLLRKVNMRVGTLTIPKVNVEYIEFNLDLGSEDLVSDVLKSANAKFNVSQGLLIIDSAQVGVTNMGDAAIIVHTRETAGKLLCSTQMMVLQASQSAGGEYSTDEAKEAAAESYGYQGRVLIQPGETSDGGVTPPSNMVKVTMSMTGCAQNETLVATAPGLAGDVVATATGTTAVEFEVEKGTSVGFNFNAEAGSLPLEYRANGTRVGTTGSPSCETTITETTTIILACTEG